jgi:hypothetical protein
MKRSQEATLNVAVWDLNWQVKESLDSEIENILKLNS